jgi:CreA protein
LHFGDRGAQPIVHLELQRFGAHTVLPVAPPLPGWARSEPPVTDAAADRRTVRRLHAFLLVFAEFERAIVRKRLLVGIDRQLGRRCLEDTDAKKVAASAATAIRHFSELLIAVRIALRLTPESDLRAGESWSLSMTNRISKRRASALIGVLALAGLAASPGRAADEPDLIFKRSTVFKWLTPNDKLATYGLDDPEVDGVACHFTVPEKGGLKGWIGVAEEVSDISLACRQVGPIRFKQKFAQGEDVFRARRSLFFKKMQIVRGCDVKRNVLVYMVYSDRLIEGSPKNSTSTVPVMPWGGSDAVQKCADWVG